MQGQPISQFAVPNQQQNLGSHTPGSSNFQRTLILAGAQKDAQVVAIPVRGAGTKGSIHERKSLEAHLACIQNASFQNRGISYLPAG